MKGSLNTPPAAPTSSPITTTFGSARIASRTAAQAAAGLEPNVSVKLTALGLAEGRAAARLDDILVAARDVQGFVRVDAEHPESLDALHDIVIAARGVGLPVGTVLQANMRRSESDLDRLAAAGMPLRLVNGAYDPKSEGVGDNAAVDAAYRALAERLLAAKIPTALGTHDDSILAALAPSAKGVAELTVTTPISLSSRPARQEASDQ